MEDLGLGRTRIKDPFETEGPTEYEKWNYRVNQVHGAMIGQMMHDMEKLEARIAEHERAHAVANQTLMQEAKPVGKAEKPN